MGKFVPPSDSSLKKTLTDDAQPPEHLDALDKTIAKAYLSFLLKHNKEDSFSQRQAFCNQAHYHPKLLDHNPHIASVSSLFLEQSNFERLQSMTLKEYMNYHFYYIHMGFRYGAEALQQTWLGHKLIKSPFDCWIYQEIIHSTRPDFIIELGVMFGGSSQFFANMLDLVGHGQLIGIDIDLSKVESIDHPRIQYIEGSSIETSTVEAIKAIIGEGSALVIADSDHEKSHVLKELEIYAQFVPVGGYLVSEDSINDPMGFHPVPNEGPQAAAKEFLHRHPEFFADTYYAEKYLLSINPYGYLKRSR